VVGVSNDAVITGARLVEHSEPIVLIGIPEDRMRRSIAGYAGTDLRAEIENGRSTSDIDIISGATVTVMVIDDSIIRGGIRVARLLGLGGLTPDAAPRE